MNNYYSQKKLQLFCITKQNLGLIGGDLNPVTCMYEKVEK